MDWKPRKLIEINYQKAIQMLMDKFLDFIPDDVTDPYEIAELLSAYASMDVFKEYSHRVAERMATNLYVEGKKTWKAVARESGMGSLLRGLLSKELEGPVGMRMKQIIENNAELISTFPLDVARYVNNFVRGEYLAGNRAENIVDTIKAKYPDVTRGRISLIARTETSKASTALTRARSEELDLNWLIWRTSQDQRVRHSHQKMEGVILNWNDPPSPERLNKEKRDYGTYLPGNIWNCRCYPESIVNLNLIQFPAKIYYGGHIQRMTLNQFRKISGEEEIKKAA